MHAKLNELITNLNAHVRIWMLEKTLPGTVANLNALDAYLNLNDVNAKFLDRSANLNARNTNLNYGFHGPDLFREFEWLLHQIEWQICEIDRENLYYPIYIELNCPQKPTKGIREYNLFCICYSDTLPRFICPIPPPPPISHDFPNVRVFFFSSGGT